jgi:cellulose synthase/poly-beta-1,6-N-acetylglucosamine synthase-like glycosyltransferase
MTRRIFALSAALVAYTYVGFPVLVLLRARLRPRPYTSAPIEPHVTILIAARNEVDALPAKLANLAELDYPADCVEIIVVSDGSTDGTEAAVMRSDDARIRLVALPRVGKAAALNAGEAAARGEILVFTDANSMFTRGALRALVAPFADPDVGGVAGDQRYLADGDEATVAGGERSYWSLDRELKRAESIAGNVISATGAIYAIRRELFAEVPAGVTDDFATSTAVIAAGKRLVFAPDAVAREPVAKSGDVEFERKVRVMTRGLKAVVLRRALLNPRRHGFYALQILSHKLLRRLMAIPLVALAVTTVRLGQRSRSKLLRTAGAAQVGVYALGATGLVLEGRTRTPRLLALPAYFCLVNVASLRAVWNVMRGRAIDRWEPRRDQP